MGRLNSQTDANGNGTLRVLLPGSTDSVVEQVAADRGRRPIRDELGPLSTQSYDALGNRTRHERYMGATLAPAQVTRTDYDGLGRARPRGRTSATPTSPMACCKV